MDTLKIDHNWPIEKQKKLKKAFKAFSKNKHWMDTITVYVHCPQNLNELFEFNIDCNYSKEFKQWAKKYNLDYIWYDEETAIISDGEIYT